jgi:thiol-disulfide isomerase/thioredoxin
MKGGMKGGNESTKRLLTVFAQVGFVLLAAVLVYSFVVVTREGEMHRRCGAACILHPDYMAVERLAPRFTLKDFKGRDVSLESFRDKVVILNFWTRTCGPCLEEMPELADLTKILADRSDVVVIAVSIDDSAEEALPALRSVLGVDPPFLTLIDPDSKVVGEKFGTHLFPETWFIDKRGVIRARFDGGRAWSNSAVIEFVDELRHGSYCPVDFNIDPRNPRHFTPHRNEAFDVTAAKLCEEGER